MGTNYYTKIVHCHYCGNSETIHLGKSSAGWKFHFQWNGGKYYKTYPQMLEWLKDKEIIDEYEELCPIEEFIEMILNKQDKSNSENGEHGDGVYFIDGYEFFDHEFC